MQNVALIVAGSLSLIAAGIHGVAGELLVIRKLPVETLVRTRFGGPRMTMAMIHVTWHVTTVAFVAVGGALVVAGTALDGDARAVAVVAAAAASGFALVAMVLGVSYMRTPRRLLNHPGPIVLTAAAVLAWLGAV